jgi:phosphodiesterase/alkaline phosphatase D-like protein
MTRLAAASFTSDQGENVLRDNTRAMLTTLPRRRLVLPALLAAFLLFVLYFGAPGARGATYVTGTPASFCSGTGSAAGECEELKGVAVDSSNGEVYVVDGGNLRVDQFQPNGTFVRAFGWNVRADAPAEETQVCTALTGCKKGVAGTTALAGQISAAGSKGIAVDPATHIVYVVSVGARVNYFDGTNGNYIGSLTGTEGTASPEAPAKFTASDGVAVGTATSTHYLYVAIGGGTGVIDKFKAAGAGGAPLPAYVCQVTGKETASATECAGAASKDGAFNGLSFNAVSGANLTVDAGETVSATEEPQSTRRDVTRFSSLGVFSSQFVPNLCGAEEPRPYALAALPGGNLLVSDCGAIASSGGTTIREYDPSSPAAPVTEFGSGTIGGSLGVAFDASGLASNGSVYVTDKVNKRVWKYSMVVPSKVLKVQKAGPGGGTITSEPAGINCGTECEKQFTSGEVVKLTASANPGSSFVSWTGCDEIVETNKCKITLSADKTVTATLATAPDVTTQAASPVAKTTATLNGTVDPNDGTVSDCHFEYGLSAPAYGSTAPCVPANPLEGDGPVAVKAEISGLTAATTYHFRLVATNAAGTVQGSDLEFTTSALNKPSVSNDAPGTITQTSIVMKGTVNNNGVAGGSSCKFEIALESAPGTAVAEPACNVTPVNGVGPTAVEATASSLSPNTKYVYRVVATNVDGTSTGTPDQKVQTLPNAPTVVNDPEGTVAQTTAVLNGHVNANGVNATCSFQVATAADTTFSAPVKTVACSPSPVPGAGGNTAVSATATALTANTAYIYRVVATNTGGTTNGTPAEAFSTLPNAPTVANSTPGTVAQTSAVLKGTVNNNSAAAGSSCKFEIALESAPGTAVAEPACNVTPVNGAGATAVEATASSLSPNTKYVYRVVATNAGGTSTGTPDQKVQTLPNAPTVVNDPEGTVAQTTAVLNGHVNANGVNATCSFQVATAADTTFSAPVKTVACSPSPVPGAGGNTAVSATATALTANTAYIYRVVATNTGGTTNGTPAEAFSTLPKAPSAVTTAGTTNLGPTSATVGGTVNPNGGDVTICKIEYGTTTGYGSDVDCESPPGSGSSPVNVLAGLSGLSPETTYHFRLVASNAGGTGTGVDRTFTTPAATCETDSSLCPPAPEQVPSSSPPPATTPPATPKKPLTCKKGFKKKKIRGKVRCVKKKHKKGNGTRNRNGA